MPVHSIPVTGRAGRAALAMEAAQTRGSLLIDDWLPMQTTILAEFNRRLRSAPRSAPSSVIPEGAATASATPPAAPSKRTFPDSGGVRDGVRDAPAFKHDDVGVPTGSSFSYTGVAATGGVSSRGGGGCTGTSGEPPLRRRRLDNGSGDASVAVATAAVGVPRAAAVIPAVLATMVSSAQSSLSDADSQATQPELDTSAEQN
jgi:hypothetical protein